MKIGLVHDEIILLNYKKEITEGKIYTTARSASLPSELNCGCITDPNSGMYVT